jgi:hypothetical protein
MFKIYSTGGSPLKLKISLTIFNASFLSSGEKGLTYLLPHGLFLSWILCPNPKERYPEAVLKIIRGGWDIISDFMRKSKLPLKKLHTFVSYFLKRVCPNKQAKKEEDHKNTKML